MVCKLPDLLQEKCLSCSHYTVTGVNCSSGAGLYSGLQTKGAALPECALLTVGRGAGTARWSLSFLSDPPMALCIAETSSVRKADTNGT